MTVASKLIDVNNAKLAIKGAIEDHGVDLTGVPFTGYAGKIAEISGGIDLPALGDEWEGGYFCGVFVVSGVTYGYVMSPKATGETIGAQWAYTTGADDSRDIFDGVLNTNLLNNQGGRPAIQWAASRVINGYSDWFIPAWKEFQALSAQIYALTQTAPFSMDPIAHWTSTATNNSTVQCITPSNSNSTGIGKSSTSQPLRVFRRVALT